MLPFFQHLLVFGSLSGGFSQEVEGAGSLHSLVVDRRGTRPPPPHTWLGGGCDAGFIVVCGV